MNDIAVTIILAFFSALLCMGRQLYERKYYVAGIAVGVVGAGGVTLALILAMR